MTTESVKGNASMSSVWTCCITVPPTDLAPGDSPIKVMGTWADTTVVVSTAMKSTWSRSPRIGFH